MFFHSWELWEQMTFVLALAIAAVIVIGYSKLLWRNRLVQRQELVDEEKRARIQQLRSSGQIVESRKSHDIPFGIRAVQSGVQVDGIWISRTANPNPTRLKLGHLRGTSTDKMSGSESSKNADISEFSRGEVLGPLLREERSLFGNGNFSGRYQVQDSMGDRPKSVGSPSSYKPRTASHLRYGSHGIYDEDALGKLEGKVKSKEKVHTHYPQRARTLDTEGESSSAAENERSPNASYESDSTLSHKRILANDRSHQGLLTSMPSIDIASLSLSTVALARPVNIVGPPQTSRAEYAIIPIESPSEELSDPFATPFMSPLESPEMKPNLPPTSVHPNWLAGPQQSTPVTRISSPFVPGELHINKSIRKVNSGFEVLPAGTFGVPRGSKKAEWKGSEYNDDAGGRRTSGKLQKKPRLSMGGRPSSSSEKP
ncbi:uncharacterized protein RSE6_08777 [Rhynchosporium secalis]|uniref:Uncharacterized protein n=1 Tax=Rhynchosporium secalis TaxID=38038 RepID=A0A1E1MG88_RHYSE|nr:uncharacterized protein RSE6_08777 [Rhynchosporium secalis]